MHSIALSLLLMTAAPSTGTAGPVARELAAFDRTRPFEAVDAIVALGPQALDEVLRILEQGTFDVEEADDPRSLLPLCAVILRDAASEWPAADVGPTLERRIDASSAVDLRALLLSHLSAHGGPDDLRRLAKLAAPDGAADLPDEFGIALEGILQRYPDAVVRVERNVPTRAAALLVSAAHALVVAEERAGLPVIAGWVGVERANDALLLERLGALASRCSPPHDARVLDVARRALGRREVETRVAAIGALGRLEDAFSTAPLADALASEHAPERAAARLALGRVVGVDLGSDARRWRSWLAREEREWRASSYAWIEDLRHVSVPTVIGAVRALATQRLYRHDAAGALEPFIEHQDERVRRVVASALGELGSELGRVALERALGDDDESVCETARVALHRLETKR